MRTIENAKEQVDVLKTVVDSLVTQESSTLYAAWCEILANSRVTLGVICLQVSQCWSP